VQALTIPSGADFVPLIKSASDATSSNFATAKANGKSLLCFNEPDLPTQGNLTVSVSNAPSSCMHPLCLAIG
jgi:hypothetical protein